MLTGMVSICWPRDPASSASQSTGITDMNHRAWPCFCFCLRQGLSLWPRVECSGVIMVHCYLELLGSSCPPALASQSAEITGVSHHAQPPFNFYNYFQSHHFKLYKQIYFSSQIITMNRAKDKWHSKKSCNPTEKVLIYLLKDLTVLWGEKWTERNA